MALQFDFLLFYYKIYIQFIVFFNNLSLIIVCRSRTASHALVAGGIPQAEAAVVADGSDWNGAEGLYREHIVLDQSGLCHY